MKVISIKFERNDFNVKFRQIL